MVIPELAGRVPARVRDLRVGQVAYVPSWLVVAHAHSHAEPALQTVLVAASTARAGMIAGSAGLEARATSAASDLQ